MCNLKWDSALLFKCCVIVLGNIEVFLAVMYRLAHPASLNVKLVGRRASSLNVMGLLRHSFHPCVHTGLTPVHNLIE